MKILHLSDSLVAGGKERQLVELLKGISTQNGFTFELALFSHEIHYTEVNKLNIKIHYLIRKNKKDPRIFYKLYKLCRKIKPDIIHTWDSMSSVYAAPITKILGIKFVNGMIRSPLTYIGLLGKDYIRSKLTFPFSDMIISNSHAGLKSFNAPYKKSVYIYNGFDLNRIKYLQDKEFVKKKYDIKTEKVVGMVASFSQEKDYETYISAAQMILQKKDNVTFLAIGDGVNLKKCKRLVKPQFQSKIKFLGEQKNVETIINIFDIGVLVSSPKFYGEGISNSIMECMSLGKPVVATDSGGTKELVLNRKTGFLVKPFDAKNMYIRIEQLLENNNLRIKLGKAGRERIKKAFNSENMIKKYKNLHRSLKF